MRTAVRAGWVLALGVLLAGCQGGSNINGQVQEAIAEHLASRPGIEVGRLLIEVESVTVEGDQAEAEVIFRSRDTPDSRMNYHYELRRADGRWRVENGRPSGAESPHPSGEEGAGSGALPEGHPPVGGGTGE